MEEEVNKLIKELTIKVGELTKMVAENETKEEKEIKEESEEISKIKISIDDLKDRLETINNRIRETKQNVEDKIVENPLAYMAGAFVGGLVIGFLTRGKEK